MAPNVNLFDLLNKKNMENALKKDRRVKRLQAEVAKRKGQKIANYSACLLLDENLTVEKAAQLVCDHLDENNREKSRSRSVHDKESKAVNKSLKEKTNRERSRSRSRSVHDKDSKAVNKSLKEETKQQGSNPGCNGSYETCATCSKNMFSLKQASSSNKQQAPSKITLDSSNKQQAPSKMTLDSSNKQQAPSKMTLDSSNKQQAPSKMTLDSSNKQQAPSKMTLDSSNKQQAPSKMTLDSSNKQQAPSKMTLDSSNKQQAPSKMTLDPASVADVINSLLPSLLPQIVEGVVATMQKEKVVLLGDSILRRMQRTSFFKNKFANHTVSDLAISGSTVGKALQTFSNFCYKRETRFLPSSNLVILLGTNDFLKNGRFDYRQYHDLIRNALTSSFFKEIILVELPPIHRKPFLAEAIDEANSWIASLAGKYEIKIIEAPQHVSKDGVHLDSWGMRLLTTSIWQLVSE